VRAGLFPVLRAGLLLSALAGCQPADNTASAASVPAPLHDRGAGAAFPPGVRAPFDYWVLALSWSPEYCAFEQARPGSAQCAQPREFIVHGLWPQFERGYPEFCDPGTRVSERTADRMQALVPDRGLVFHQWKKHGSCSGLAPDAYFTQMERAARALTIPADSLRAAARGRVARADLERAFLAANPALRPEMITFECRRGYLREVRVCLDLSLHPRACGADVNEGCSRELRVRTASAH
jgi:ribonuclease T2